MKRFSFSLQAVHNWRSAQLEAAERELASRTAVVTEAQAKLDGLVSQQWKASETYLDVLSQPTVTPDEIALHTAYLGHLAQREQVERERLKDLATAQDAQRSVTLEANRQVQVLETLQTRQRTQYVTEMKRLEQKSLDEITTMAFVRRRLEGQLA